MASKTWTLKANALCDLQTVKDALNLDSTVTTSDQALTRQINRASAEIDRVIGRGGTSLAYVSEMYPITVVRSPRLVLKRTPILYVPSAVGGNPAWSAIGLNVYQDANPGPGSLVDPSQYDLEDPKKGWLYSLSRWAETSIRLSGVVRPDYETGTAESTFQATYWGGYVTLPQVESTTASGANSVNAGATAKWAANGVHAVGDLVVPTAADTGTPNQLWICTSAGQSGGAEPTWGSPAIGGTKADGTATWTFAGGRNLPEDLEDACVRLVMHWFNIATGDLDASSERMGSGGVTYAGQTGADGKRRVAGRAGIPDAIMQTLRAYQRRL